MKWAETRQTRTNRHVKWVPVKVSHTYFKSGLCLLLTLDRQRERNEGLKAIEKRTVIYQLDEEPLSYPPQPSQLFDRLTR